MCLFSQVTFYDELGQMERREKVTNENEAKRLAFYLFYNVKTDFERWGFGEGRQLAHPHCFAPCFPIFALAVSRTLRVGGLPNVRIGFGRRGKGETVHS